MLFLGTYPVVGALLWITGSSAFSDFREGNRADALQWMVPHLVRLGPRWPPRKSR